MEHWIHPSIHPHIHTHIYSHSASRSISHPFCDRPSFASAIRHPHTHPLTHTRTRTYSYAFHCLCCWCWCWCEGHIGQRAGGGGNCGTHGWALCMRGAEPGDLTAAIAGDMGGTSVEVEVGDSTAGTCPCVKVRRGPK
mmetsp:Transcript_6011/g.17134  ORF Transcript_6011/g.17134 Transcript_6011/m.17134 type:complete len:138 (+) Transcript_6011:111-524(+)